MRGKVIIVSGAKQVIEKMKENKVCSLFCRGDGGRWKRVFALGMMRSQVGWDVGRVLVCHRTTVF